MEQPRQKINAFYKSPIPIDWKSTTIGELIKFSGGSQPERKLFKFSEIDGYVRLIQTRDYRTSKYKTYVPKELVRKFCSTDDIMIGRYGPPVFQLFRGLEGAYNVALIKATPKKEVEKDYCFYFLSRPELRNYIESLSQRSGGQTGVDIDKLNQHPFALPPLPEQRAIAKVLAKMDEAINANNQLISQKALRKKWFMQNLLTGKKRLKGFSGEWKEVHISDVSKEVSLRNKEDKQLTVLSCTKYDGLVPSLEYFGKKIYSDDLSTYKIVQKNHFAYATNHIEEGSIGYNEELDEALISPMYTIFKTEKSVNDVFFYKLLKSHRLIYEYNARMEGSIDRRGGLRWSAFSIIKIKLPSFEEQTAIAQILQAVDKELTLLKAKTDKLKEQKKGMMQVLLTGKKRLNQDL
jgi:type I restriction enzyme S subunit